MTFGDDLSPEERATVELATRLGDSGNLQPLIVQMRNGAVGPQRARDALRVLAELDLDLLVQITLDSLIATYLEEPGLVDQPRRAVGGKAPIHTEPDG